MVSPGVPPEGTETVIINVPPYTGSYTSAPYKYHGANAYITHYGLINRMIHAPCVTFDAPVNYRQTFNFGQELDQKCLNKVCKEAVRNNPNALIVLMDHVRAERKLQIIYLIQNTKNTRVRLSCCP